MDEDKFYIGAKGLLWFEIVSRSNSYVEINLVGTKETIWVTEADLEKLREDS